MRVKIVRVSEVLTREVTLNLLDKLMPKLRRRLCGGATETVSDVALSESGSAALPDAPGIQQFTLAMPRRDVGKLLDFLSAQALFPKFYWLHRDGSEEVAALGLVRLFDCPSSVSAFLRAHNTPLRVWGGTAFDGELARDHDGLRGWFFLPRLELRQTTKGAWLTVNLHSDTSLRADGLLAWEQITQLVSAQSLNLPNVTVERVRHAPDKAGWFSLIRKSLAAIEAQAFEKVVLARKTTLTLDKPVAPAELLAASRRVNHRCFHFMLALDDSNGFVGSSPERLFRRREHALLTEALAGTVSRTGDDIQDEQLAQWLLSDKKNQHENLLVVEDICSRLSGHVDNLDVLPAEVLALRKVQHLRRRITAQLRHVDDAECLTWLHPTAAVAGLPREPARHFIHEHEPFERGWYAGSVGYISREHTEFTVAIRSALIQQNQVHLFAGAGIVPGSDPEAEWQEIERKAAGLRTLLEPDYVNKCL